MVCASEKYAFKIEIFTFGRGFSARISRSSVQKKAFSPVNVQAVCADRIFQQNRPVAAVGIRIVERPARTKVSGALPVYARYKHDAQAIGKCSKVT